MRRSEAIQLIEDNIILILANNPDTGVDLSTTIADIMGDVKRIASDILDVVEGVAGMQPPPHQERLGSGYADEYGNEESYDEWVQGWEAE